MRVRRKLPLFSALVLLLGGLGRAQTTQLLSRGVGGGQSNDDSGMWLDPSSGNLVFAGYAMTPDGRYVAYSSMATNLVPGDTNVQADVFRYDRQTGATLCASVGLGGAQANWGSGSPSISADGRYVAFASGANNLVAGDTNGVFDVFVYDCAASSTVRASVDSAGGQSNNSSNAPALSADGRYVAFVSLASNLVPGDTNGNYDVFVRDLQAGTTTRASVNSQGAQSGGAAARWPVISSNGRFVAFESDASNLVTGDTNGKIDVFVHDMQTGSTVRASVSSSGVQANNDCEYPMISADGRYVGFDSSASNLVPTGANGMDQVYVHDLQSGATTLVSVDSFGNSGDSGSLLPSFSSDDRYVAFTSFADNLVPNDFNASGDVFVHDMQTGATTCVSVDSSGNPGNGESDLYWNQNVFASTGRYVAFMSGSTNLVPGDTNGKYDIFLRDQQTGTTTRVSVEGVGLPGNNNSNAPTITPDGRYLAFSSDASDLVQGDTNNKSDVFVLDRQSGAMVRASVGSNGVQGNGHSYSPALSADGRYAVFVTEATNLFPGDNNGTYDIVVHDSQTGATTNANVDSNGMQGNSVGGGGAISSDGRYVAFWSYSTLVAGDTNNAADIFLRDVQAGTTSRMSVSTGGAQGDADSFAPAITPDGRYVAFESSADNLVSGDTNGHMDVFVRDRQSGTTRRASVDSNGGQGNDNSSNTAISADGRYVAFLSFAGNLVPGDSNGTWDAFVHDMQTGATTRVSVASNGAQADGPSNAVAISPDGRYVAFESDATNLVPGDTNGAGDIFLRDLLTGRTERVSVSSTGGQADQLSTYFAVSAGGRYVAFDSRATNLVSGDTNGWSDVFLRDRGNDAVFAAFCFGDGSGAACPCSNSGAAGHGCQNSAGTGGAILTGTGTPSLASDTVHFTSSGELPTSTSILLSGPTPVNPAHYGDGLRCAGGSLKRLFTHSAVGGVVAMPQGSDLSVSARSAAMGDPITAGSVRIYQVYYRDPSATFCSTPTGATFNISNALALAWGP